jgi:hypothetical protein
VTPDWALMRTILAGLAVDDGQTDDELAERLGRTAAEIRPAARILHHQRKTDTCWGRNVLVPRARERRVAA